MSEAYAKAEVEGLDVAGWYCDEITDDRRGLRIVLVDPSSKRRVALVFVGHLAYRNVREEVRMRTFLARKPEGTSGLYTVSGSEWLAWLRAESGGPLDERPLVHYALFTDEDCVDVATEFPPTLELVAG